MKRKGRSSRRACRWRRHRCQVSGFRCQLSAIRNQLVRAIYLYICTAMKKLAFKLVFVAVFSLFMMGNADAQCSICAKTTQQMGDKPAKGFNSGIIYLMLTPFAIMGFIGYRWWKNNQELI